MGNVKTGSGETYIMQYLYYTNSVFVLFQMACDDQCKFVSLNIFTN